MCKYSVYNIYMHPINNMFSFNAIVFHYHTILGGKMEKRLLTYTRNICGVRHLIADLDKNSIFICILL
jgi:hypothetical protein